MLPAQPTLAHPLALTAAALMELQDAELARAAQLQQARVDAVLAGLPSAAAVADGASTRSCWAEDGAASQDDNVAKATTEERQVWRVVGRWPCAVAVHSASHCPSAAMAALSRASVPSCPSWIWPIMLTNPTVKYRGEATRKTGAELIVRVDSQP